MKKTEVTIIMPLYNKGKYLPRAIESVLSQDIDYDYQIIIIDDISTDNGYEIASDYAKKYPEKIILKSNTNKRYCFGTTLDAFKALDTKYFTVLDPDDYWLTDDKLKNAIEYLGAHEDCSAYMSNSYLENGAERTVYIDNKSQSFSDCRDYIPGHTSSAIYKNFFTQEYFTKLDKIDNTGKMKFFDGETFRNHLALSTGTIYYSDVIESVYNITGDGIWTSLSKDIQSIMHANAMLAFFDFFEDNNLYWLESAYKQVRLIDMNDNNSSELTSIYSRCYKNRNISKKLKSLLNIEALCFFMPSKAPNNDALLFYKLAKFFANEFNIKIYYIDYEDGFISTCEKRENIQHSIYTDGMEKIDIPENISLIAPIQWAKKMPKFAKMRHALYLVDLFKDFDFIKTSYGLSDRKTKDFLIDLNYQNSLAFMGDDCYTSFQSVLGDTLAYNVVSDIELDKGIDNKNEIALFALQIFNLLIRSTPSQRGISFRLANISARLGLVKRYKLFVYSLYYALLQLPIIYSLTKKKKREKVFSKIERYSR